MMTLTLFPVCENLIANVTNKLPLACALYNMATVAIKSNHCRVLGAGKVSPICVIVT